MLQLKASSLIAHIIVWIVFLSLPLLFISGQPDGSNILPLLFSINYFIFFITYISVFYFNAYFLVPKFYLKNKMIIYFSVFLSLGLIISFIKPFDNLLAASRQPRLPNKEEVIQYFPGPPPPNGEFRPPPNTNGNDHPKRIDAISIFLFVMVMGISAAVSITRQWYLTEQRASRAEADKANAELSFLKAQINPHFLFNTLNNIYSLAVTKNENTADCIMKLSNIMRYVTDEATEDYVPFQNEISCITDYIGLQKMRLGDKATIDFGVNGNIESKKIAPLILMSFIENIFKYGISKHEPSTIEIKIFSDKDSIDFFCKNKIFNASINEDRKGVGIENTKKRLEYLYHEKYFLNIKKENGFYEVLLSLKA